MATLLRNVSRAGLLVLTVAVAEPRLPASVLRQEPCNLDKGPLTFDGVKDALDAIAAGIRVDIAGYVNRCGATFILDDEGAAQLRVLGATPELLALLMPPSRPSTGASWRPLTDHRDMKWVESGTFTMGSPRDEAGRKDDEKAHSVTLRSGFWLDATEVTNEAYLQFVKAQPQWSKVQAHDGKDYLKDWTGNAFPPGAGNRPVVFVSWRAALEYATWAGKRLPAESEWEYAARAGTTRAYWWGSEFGADRSNNSNEPWPADQVETRNPWGFFNMLGNVWEWTSTIYRADYETGDRRDAADAAGSRVVRGGGFGQQRPANFRAANRSQLEPDRSYFNVGFRCAYGK